MDPKLLYKFCPICKSEFNNKTNGHYLECINCKFKYYIAPRTCIIAIIVNQKGEILFGQRKKDPHKGKIDFPGGFIDLGETVEDAVKREVKEETNLEVIGLEYIVSTIDKYNYGPAIYDTLAFAFKLKIKDFSIMHAGDDIENLIFIEKDKVDINQIAFGASRTILREYI